VEVFNARLGTFQSAGLIDYWASIYVDENFCNANKNDSAEPTELTLAHLQGVFEVWIVLNISCLTAFVGEIICANMKKLKCFR